MPDISMCDDKQCPQRNECYRFTATPDTHAQVYAEFKYNLNDGCSAFKRNRVRGVLKQ